MASKRRLEEAAEELVKAAYLDVKEVSESAATKETVKAIQESNKQLQTLREHQASLKESIDAKLNTLSQNVTDVKTSLDKLQEITEKQTRSQNLNWALQNLSLADKVTYYIDGYDKHSDSLVKQILLSFRKGLGFYLPDKATLKTSYYNRTPDAKAKNEREFRDKISSIIHELTTIKPRVVQEKGSQYAIYYS